MSRGPVSGSTCSLQGAFLDWKTNSIIPCEDGCQGDGNP